MAKQTTSVEELRLKDILGKIKKLTDEAEFIEPSQALVATPLPVAVSIERAAALLAVAPSTLSEYTHSGQLPTFRLGRRLLVRLDALHAFAKMLENAKSASSSLD